jgi:hypothetical protein
LHVLKKYVKKKVKPKGCKALGYMYVETLWCTPNPLYRLKYEYKVETTKE